MATQSTKIIDVTKTYIPLDPNAFPENYSGISKEDSPETHKDIVIYEGFNFLPTSYGYRSFFGVDSQLDIDALPPRCDELFFVQKNTFETFAVALCEDGIWTKQGTISGSWNHEITITVPDEGVHLDWSYCIIGNNLFCYRAGEPQYYRYSDRPVFALDGITVVHPAYAFYAVTPTFLNMSGQIGIYKAGGRLGFWDSENSTSWSNLDDFADFVPDVSTLAGNLIFVEITGRITNILSHGDGFVIYATKSIILIQRTSDASFQWSPKVLCKNAGVAFRKECCSGASDTTQFAYTSIGLQQIENGDATVIIPNVTDFLKESTQPIYTKVIEGRYLFLEILDANYLNGLVSFTQQAVDSASYKFIVDYLSGTDPTQLAEIDKYIAANGLPPRNGEPVHPVLQFNYQDKHIVRPIGDELPLIYGEQFHLIGNDGSYIDYSTYGDYLPHPNYITRDVFVGEGGAVPTRTFLSAPGVESPAVRVVSGFLIQPGNDNSRSVIGTTLDKYITEQKRIWAANDFEVNDMLAYMSLYTNEIDFGSTLLTYNDPANPSHNIDLTGGFAPIFTYDLTGGHAGERRYINSYLRNSSLTNNGLTLDSAWNDPYMSLDAGLVKLTRERKHITTVFTELTIDVDNTFVITGGAGETATYCISHASVSTFGLEGNTTGAPNNPTQSGSVGITSYGYSGGSIPGNIFQPNAPQFTVPSPLALPPSSFLLQNGSIGPVYPTIPGALVFDMQLKKWGKMKQDYKLLLDYTPINNIAGQIIPYENFGVSGGVLLANGKIALFNRNPVDSYLRYGKVGYWRQGVTSAEEIRVHFRTPSSGILEIQSSIDGTVIDTSLTRQEFFSVSLETILYPSTTARWHTIGLRGIYDLKHLEFRGTLVGNR